ncbi:PilZ domain-containing protein [Microvirga splendida]|uniref:PilZ domain-containing protein n=1 Tax=Microvirga splendida TaxID=2795727 RepID=A0ABS0XWF5_9HYPH|nr:PilZ domain-containing protein [Microvirga splendida]MBJ6124375.1 PilZ domain-containing protein [Microvirga splendida]
MPERRSDERFATVLEGRIAGANGQAPIECFVRDLSRSGVRLVIDGSADIPVEFELQIPDAGAAAMTRLVWTDGTHYGAQFTG